MKTTRLFIILAALSVALAHAEAKKVPCDPLTGDATAAGAKALNPFKNRSTAPKAADIDRRITLAAILKPGDDTHRFPMTKAATITGYVVSAKVGGIETCNCHAKDPKDRDTHIDVVADPKFAVKKLISVTTTGKDGKKHTIKKDANEKYHVVVEVTPRVRQRMKAKGLDWSTDTLHKTLPGHFVRFTGWMLFDTEHKDESENTTPGRKLNWRATCNEIHPVFAINIVK
jgi:hypothetical protein